MTFQIIYSQQIERENRLRILYSVEGELPGCIYTFRKGSFNSNGYTFNVNVSVTGEFILETDQAFSKRLENNGRIGSLDPVDPVDPLEALGERLHRHIQDKFETLEKRAEMPQSKLDI